MGALRNSFGMSLRANFRTYLVNRTVAAVTLNDSIRSMGRYGAFVTLPIYLLTIRDVSFLEIGLYFTIASFIAIPANIFGGNLIDRIGRRPLFLTLPLVLAAIYLLMSVVVLRDLQYYWVFVLYSAVITLSSIQGTVDSVLIVDNTEEVRRNDAFGLQRIGYNLGSAAGPTLGGFLLIHAYSYLFLLMAIFSVVEEFIYFTQIGESKRKTSSESPQKMPLRHSFPIRDRLFISIAIILSLLWFISSTGFEGTTLPMFLTDTYSYTSFQVGILFSINALVVVSLQIPINRIMFRWSSKDRIVIAGIIYALSFLVIGLTDNFLLLIADVVVITTAENIMAPPSQSIIAEISPEEKRGQYYGAAGAIGSAIGPFSSLFGSMLLLYFSGLPLLMYGIICGFALLFSFLMFNVKYERRKATISGA